MFKKSITALLLIIAILSLSACIKEPIEPIEPIELIDYTVYTLSYALDGGILNTTNPGSYNSQTPSFTLNNPTKEDFTFVGWSTSADLSNPQSTVTISPGTKGNTTFYAVWHKLIKYFTVPVIVRTEIFSSWTREIIYSELGETVEFEFIVDPKYYGYTLKYDLTYFSSYLRPVSIISDIVVLSDKIVVPYTITTHFAASVILAAKITPPHRNGIWVENNSLFNNSSDYFSFFSGEIGETVELEFSPSSDSYGWTLEFYLGEKLPEGVKPQLTTIVLTEKVTLKYTMTKSCHYLEFYIAEVIN